MASEDDKTETGHLFMFTREKSVRDDHLLFSIFLKSERSRFTRVQRAATSCAMTFIVMLINAMW